MKVSELEAEVSTEILNECGEKAKSILRSKLKSVKRAEKVLAMLKKDLEEFKNSDVEDLESSDHNY
jgi:hypothetical protein